MYWHKMNDRKAGGLWRCVITKRTTDRAVFLRRYDRDPIFRLERNMRKNAHDRRLTLARMRSAA